MVRMVFSDMDGTFYSPEKVMLPTNARMLDVLAERGIGFVPCTGRSVNGLPEELTGHAAVSYAICCNGAEIYDVRSGSLLHADALSRERAHELFDLTRDLKMTFDVFSGSTVYTERRRWELLPVLPLPEATRKMVRGMRTPFDGDVHELIDQLDCIGKINLYYFSEEDRQLVLDYVDAHDELYRTTSLPCNIEVSSSRASKGTALEWLCEHVGVSAADAMAFGDGDNDVPMLRAAGDGVAMSNADPHVIEAADHVCGSCSESGVGAYVLAALG